MLLATNWISSVLSSNHFSVLFLFGYLAFFLFPEFYCQGTFCYAGIKFGRFLTHPSTHYSDVTLTPPYNSEGAKFWITCKWLASLSSLSPLQVIQNKGPGVRRRHKWQLDVSINIVQNISNVGHFLDPPSQFLCWSSIGWSPTKDSYPKWILLDINSSAVCKLCYAWGPANYFCSQWVLRFCW